MEKELQVQTLWGLFYTAVQPVGEATYFSFDSLKENTKSNPAVK